MAPGAHKVRGKAERFADHYTQAKLFWNSQTPVERTHIVNAFKFELSRVQTPAVRERMVSGLMNVDAELAEAVALGLGIQPMPTPMPKVLRTEITPEIATSPSLSLFARPGNAGIRTRRVAVLVADGVDGDALRGIVERLVAAGAVPRFVGPRLGSAQSVTGDAIEIDVPMHAAPSVLFDALILPDGADAVDRLNADGRALEFVKDQYRHCKPILVLGAASQVLDRAGIPQKLPNGERDSGLVFGSSSDNAAVTEAFVDALAKHRHFDRETDPPLV
jgi:catalase